MFILRLALRNLFRRPVRTGLALAGFAAATTALGCLLGFSAGYRRALGQELDRMGAHLMLVPLGCPYDAAARVLKGNVLDHSLPEAALAAVRRDPAVAVAGPLLMVSAPRPSEKRADLWVGLDEATRDLKPWWQAKSGASWFPDAGSVILGAEAAAVELRTPGDKLFSPGVNRALRVAGVLARSGTSDDSLFFVPLGTAQEMFQQPGRLTAIAIRLRDPALIGEATERLQKIPGAQTVTLTEMMGVFLTLVGAVTTLMQAIAGIALVISGLGLFNILLATVLNRVAEFSVLRALGASRPQVFALVAMESLLLAGAGSALGLLFTVVAGAPVETAVKYFVPFAPTESMLDLTLPLALECLGFGLVVGLAAGLYPAWQASTAQPALALKLAT